MSRHTVNKHATAKRRLARNDVWKGIVIRKLKLADGYNEKMLRVDISDQMIGLYSIL